MAELSALADGSTIGEDEAIMIDDPRSTVERATAYLGDVIESLFPPLLQNALARLIDQDMLRVPAAPSHNLRRLLRSTRDEAIDEKGKPALYVALPYEATPEEAAYLLSALKALQSRWRMRVGEPLPEQLRFLSLPWGQANYACEVAIAEAERSAKADGERSDT